MKPHPFWTAGVAVVTAFTIVIEATLIGAALFDLRAGQAVAEIVCSHDGLGTPTPPGEPAHRKHDACCILCTTPGLEGADVPIIQSRPIARASPTFLPRPFGRLPGMIERLPGEPRAPPRAA